MKMDSVTNLTAFYNKQMFSVNMDRTGDVSKAFDALSYIFSRLHRDLSCLASWNVASAHGRGTGTK